MKSLGFFIFAFILSQPAFAKLFTNSYISFELPDQWSCSLDKTEWICRSDAAGANREAVIILTAKEVGPTDSLAQYENYLKTPKAITGADGKPVMSQIKQVKQMQISGHAWVDGMHLGSEVPYYYTRYLATIKVQIAILVTFSAHQRYYTKYSNDFFKAIQSLRVIAAPNLVNASNSTGGIIGSASGIPMDMGDGELPNEPTGSSRSKKNALLLAILLAAIGGYIFIKKRKKT